MITDSHLHIGLNGWTEAKLLDYLDRSGIESAWILTWDESNPVVPQYYIPLDIDEVRTVYRNHPGRIVPFYAPDPSRKDWKDRFLKSLDEGFAGCGELKVPYRWNDPLMEPLLRLLNDRKLPLIFHMERARNIFIPEKERGMDWLMKRLYNERFNGKWAHRLEQWKKNTGFLEGYLKKRLVEFPGYLLDFMELEEAGRTYPDIRFICHGPHIWNNFSLPSRDYLFHQEGKVKGRGLLWELLESNANMYCDLSGFSGMNALSRDRERSLEFLEKFHHKLLFGTDNVEMGLQKFLSGIGLDSEKSGNIFHGNADRVRRA